MPSDLLTSVDNVTWAEIYERFSGQWVAMAISELATNGIKKGTVIAHGKSEDQIEAKLRQFEAKNPGCMTSLINTGPFDDIDIIRPGPWLP